MKWLALISVVTVGTLYLFDTGMEPNEYGYNGPCPDFTRAYIAATNRIIERTGDSASVIPDYEAGEGGRVQILDEGYQGADRQCRYRVTLEYSFRNDQGHTIHRDPAMTIVWVEGSGWRAE